MAGLTELFTGVKLSGGWSISREAVSQQVNTELEAVRSILAGDNPVRPLIRLKALEHLSSGWGLFQLTKYALLAKQGSDALEFARRLVKQDPRNVPFLTLAAFAEAAAGSVDVAQKAVDRLKALSQEVDDSSPFSVRMIAELRNQGLLIQGEWREPFEAWRKIHESRPSLPTLGPLLSTPQHMDDFAWVDDKGKHFQFSKITSGRPAVVALLLGDCPHCDAQFGLLEGQRDKLKEKGIDLVSVFSLPENLPVYRKNWAFDEFESIPLHGLFIVNAQREVVWQDVSADAFLDIEFLMAEVDRALSPLQTKLMHGRPL
ncbi:MAG: hypothetical protein NTV34_00170 [Proteobacteria bacterium]|nr:hypothetical protein [Pseudomonadota bacterium]